MKRRIIKKKTQNPVVRLLPPIELYERYKNISRQEGFGTVSAWVTATLNRRMDDIINDQAIKALEANKFGEEKSSGS